MLYNGSLSLSPPLKTGAAWFAAVALPALAIYFLYHPVVEVALRGSTPGQARRRGARGEPRRRRRQHGRAAGAQRLSAHRRVCRPSTASGSR